MVKTFEELIENRRKLIEAHKENGFSEGIHALLTDLYPDKAHFIFELLQNAEDMMATKVFFELYRNKLVFKHNGTKRQFNLNDIDAITSIGNNPQKKDDKTTIGKFGVGFKSVLAYTATPEIHSGDYHFRIIEDFLPEQTGVKNLSTKDKNGIDWTIFIFPFNHPEKSKEQAFSEIKEQLLELNQDAILFLRYIKDISYFIKNPNNKGFVKFNQEDDIRVSVICGSAEKEEFTTNWLRFTKTVEMEDEKGNLKNCFIGIAYALSTREKKKESIVPVNDSNAFIYFPAEKEKTGLRFLINAPFASTVARDCVRDISKNHELIEHIAGLVCVSLPKIKDLGLMNNDFFNVLPNNRDFSWKSEQYPYTDHEMHEMYLPILETVKKAFKENEYLPTLDGNYVTSENALRGSLAAFTEILKQDLLKQVMGNDKKWIKNVTKGSCADRFFDSINVEEFGYKNFEDLFNNETGLDNYFNDLIAEYKENCDLDNDIVDWFVKFYSLCSKVYDEINYNDKNSFLLKLNDSNIILSENLEFFKPVNIYFNNGNENINNDNSIKYVNHLIADKNSTIDSIRNNAVFFESKLDIKVYDYEQKIINTIAEYEALDEIDINDEKYFNYIFIGSVFAGIDDYQNLLLYKDKKIFIYEDGNKFKLAKASDLVLDKKYGNNNSEFLCNIYDKPCLWDGYIEKFCESINSKNAEKFRERILSEFLEFVRKCNIIEDLRVERRKAEYHPMFSEWLNSKGKSSVCGENEDYYIPELDKKMEYVGFNKYLWDFLKAQTSNIWAKARYSPNRSSVVKESKSSLFYDLQNIAWLPNKLGNLFKPSEISIQDLADDFVYDENAPLLIALGLKETSEKVKEVNDYLQKTGQIAVDADSFAEFTEWKKKLEDRKRKLEARKKRSNNEYSNTAEIFEAETKEENCFEDEEEDYFSIAESTGVVRNPERRQQKIEETFNDLKELKSEAKYSYRKVQKSSEDEKINLKGWYNGKCQMCGKQIITYDHKPYFEAINIVSTSHLPEELVNTEQLCWNSLCLCPNCAAEYKHCSKNIVSFDEQIRETEVKKNDDSNIELTLNIAGETRIIKFCHKHFLALKTAFKLIDKQYNNENDL